MQQIKAIKVLLESEEKELCILDGQSKICNWLYNHLLEKVNQNKALFIQGDKEKGKIIYSKWGIRDLIPNLKEDFPFLKSVHSSPLKNVALRLSETIKRHQKDKTLGWPHFKSWNEKWFSLFYDEPQKGFKIDGDKLILSLGTDEKKKRLSAELKIKDFQLLKDYKPRNLRIIKENGEYYAIFTVEALLPEKKPIKKMIALDPDLIPKNCSTTI